MRIFFIIFINLDSVKEGLIYQDCIGALAQALVTDSLMGSPHCVNITHLSVAQLSKAIEMCDRNHLQDISAIAIIEIASKLLEIRRLFLIYFQVEEEKEKFSKRFSRDSEDSEVTKNLVSAIEDYFAFFSRVNEILRNTFQIPDEIDYLRQTENSNFDSGSSSHADSNRRSILGRQNFSLTLRDSKSAEVDWTHELYLSVCCASEEIKLMQSHVTFRNVKKAVVASLEVVPDCLNPFLDPKKNLMAALQRMDLELGRAMGTQKDSIHDLLDNTSVARSASLGHGNDGGLVFASNMVSESGDSMATSSSDSSSSSSLLAVEDLLFDCSSHSGEQGQGQGQRLGQDDAEKHHEHADGFHISVLRRVISIL